MTRLRLSFFVVTGFVLGSHCSQALVPRITGTSGPSWEDVATWDAVHPILTRNIVYANVSVPGNPSANPNPGTPGGIEASIPNSPAAAPGTIDLHLDVLRVPSAKPTPVVLQLHGGG